MKREIQEIKVLLAYRVTLDYKESRDLQEFKVKRVILVLRATLV